MIRGLAPSLAPLALATLLAACNPTASTSPSATAAGSSSTAVTVTSTGPASTDADGVALRKFFDILRDRVLARVEEAKKKTYKSRAGFALDMVMLTPDGALHDARTNPSAYQGTAEAASHALAARADLREAEVNRFMEAVSGPVDGVMKELGASVAGLPEANTDDCLDVVRTALADRALAAPLGKVTTTCSSILTPKDLDCAKDARTVADFDGCRSRPAAPSAKPSASK
jgi:hypothetical protein